MFVASFFRLIRLLVTSVVCSLPIYLGSSGVVTASEVVLGLAFFVFVVVTGMDTYRFSISFWKIQDYLIGQLLPLFLYIGLGFLTCLTARPVVFNRIFLPLRFAGCFRLRTLPSIVVVGLILVVIVTALRFLGARAGRLEAMEEAMAEVEAGVTATEAEEPESAFLP